MACEHNFRNDRGRGITAVLAQIVQALNENKSENDADQTSMISSV